MEFLKTLPPIHKILVYTALTILFSFPFWSLIIKAGAIESNLLLPLGLMWMPGAAGLVCSLVFGHRLKDIGFRRGAWKFYGIAYGIPALVALFILAGLLVFRLGEFEVSPQLLEKRGSMESAMIALFLLAPLMGTITGVVATLGEEIGWRGFLLTQMFQANPRFADFLTGFIWSLWHWPLIFLSDYATSPIPWLSALLFSASLTLMGPYYGWLRRNSNSIFPLALTHASHNVFIQAIYPALVKKGPLDAYFGGEAGVFAVLAYAIVGVYFFRLNQKGRAEAATA